MNKNSFTLYLYKAKIDFISSLLAWRIFCMMGISDIKKRYTRSKIGQFWLTLSLAINISLLGIVWSYLFKMPVADYLPFLAISTVFWTYISTCILEGSNLYIGSASYLQSLNLPKLTYINSLFVKNIIVLLHNLPVVVLVLLFYSTPIPVANILVSVLSLMLTTMFLYPIIMMLALLGLRFRDFANIIASLMQIIFYVTPIMWKVNLMPARFHHYLILNPFAVFISLCRDSLVDIKVTREYWLAALLYIVIMWLIAFPFYSRFRARITYWL